jgi:hypothetical protein
MTYTKRDVVVLKEEWIDITTLDGFEDIVSEDITVVANFVNNAYICIGGSATPVGNNGSLLLTGTGVTGNSDHWWVKGYGTLSIIVG